MAGRLNVEIIVALDFGDTQSALRLVDELGDECDFYKVGLELFTASGPAVISSLCQRDKRVFLDLKLHDIPNTARGAARSAARLGAALITVHVAGGSAMLAAALAGASEGAGPGGCEVFGVSVLTSLGADDLGRIWGRSGPLDTSAEVSRLALIAAEAGLHGLVCSAQELAAVRGSTGNRLSLLTPGIRLEGSTVHDQVRVATPVAARDLGATHLVLGRAISASADPAGALRQVQRDLFP